MIKALIFDLWSTLATDRISFYRSFYKIVKPKMDLHRFLKIYERITQIETSTEKDAVNKMLTKFKVKDKAKQDKIWSITGMHRKHLYSDTKELIPKLAKDYKIALISNTTEAAAKVLDPVRKHFKVITYSCREGIMKPNKEIFLRTLKKLKVKPHEAVMIGDNPLDDYAASRKVGMHAVLIDRKQANPDFKPRICTLYGLRQKLNQGFFDK